jgi:hypothetical protein
VTYLNQESLSITFQRMMKFSKCIESKRFTQTKKTGRLSEILLNQPSERIPQLQTTSKSNTPKSVLSLSQSGLLRRTRTLIHFCILGF